MMIDRKFTTGEWDFRPSAAGSFFYIETVDKTHKNTFIGDIGGGLQPIKEIKANAKLIAAAPDMLDALEAAYTLLVSEGKENTIIANQILAVINKAI